jgi:hypothetical protein
MVLSGQCHEHSVTNSSRGLLAHSSSRDKMLADFLPLFTKEYIESGAHRGALESREKPKKLDDWP